MKRPAGFEVRRIMVALDGSTHANAALDAAVALALQLHADLEGVFVQDADLAKLAALPVGREIQFLTGEGRDFTVEALAAQNSEQESCAKRAMAAAAARARVSHAFRVVRGRVSAEVINAAGRADLLVVGVGSTLPGGRTRLGGTARAMAEHAPLPVMISKPGARRAGRPLVIYDGSADAEHALQAAMRTFSTGDRGIAVLIDADDGARLQTLRKHVADRLASLGLPGSIIDGADPAPDQLCRLAADADANLLVIPASSRAVAGARRQRVLEAIACPVLFVR